MQNKTIRLISLNAWCGRSLYPLMNFFKNKADQVDVFCLQEIQNGDQAIINKRHPDEHVCGPLFQKILDELKDFEGSFAYFDDDPNRMSLAIFWRRGLPVKTIEDFLVYKPEQPKETGSIVFSPRKLQYLTLDVGGKEILIANYHGLWSSGPKTDSPERITQSDKIKEFLDKYSGPKILCGDFNLLPDTKSVDILEIGMENLIKKYKIKSTRTALYRHFDNEAEPNFADYIFISPEIKVKKFEIMPDLVSDHSPLYLEFDPQGHFQISSKSDLAIFEKEWFSIIKAKPFFSKIITHTLLS